METNNKTTGKLTKVEKKLIRKQKRKLIREFSRGTKLHFLLGIIGIIAAIVSQYLIPLISSFTIDYVLKDYADVNYPAV